LQPSHLVKQDQVLLDSLWAAKGFTREFNGQTREITDFFWAQEKYLIEGTQKSRIAVPGIKGFFTL